MPSTQDVQASFYIPAHDVHQQDNFYYPAHEVQKPTISRVHVRSAEDAHVVFESVRRGLYRPVCRRLNDTERSMYIRSGSVFVWQETEDSIGLRRWTDGLVWSASRMREPFLFYETRNKTSGSSSPRSSLDTPGSTPPRSSFDQNIPGLVKQTYSAIVVGDGSKRKWHLTAYFSHADYDKLPTVADDPILRQLVVPGGMYRSGKSRTSQKTQQTEWNGVDMSVLDSPTGDESSSASGSPNMDYRRQPPSPSSRPGSSHHTSSQPSSPFISSQYPFPQQPNPSRPHTATSVFAYGPPSSPSHKQLSQPSSPFPRPLTGPAHTSLPPLHATLTDPRLVFSGVPGRGNHREPRSSEDERMLQLLNTGRLM